MGAAVIEIAATRDLGEAMGGVEVATASAVATGLVTAGLTLATAAALVTVFGVSPARACMGICSPNPRCRVAL